MRNRPAVLFDLDGTLIDSSEDLRAAVNHVRESLALRPLTVRETLACVGDGVLNLLGRAIPEHDASELLPRFQAYYRAHATVHTRLYPGISEAIDTLGDLALLAVVSNKPEEFTRLILEDLGCADAFAAVAGGDTFSEKKPSPKPLLRVLASLGASSDRAVMVGDGIQDLRAGQSAGVRTCGVLWGFSDADVLARERPDALIERPDQLVSTIEEFLAR